VSRQSTRLDFASDPADESIAATALLVAIVAPPRAEAGTPARDMVALDASLRAGEGGAVVAAPTVGQEVIFHVTFRVAGPAGLVGVSLRAFLDDVEFCVTNTTAVAGVEFLGFCSRAWVATAGAHTLRWELGIDGGETSLANNAVALPIVVGGGTPPTAIVTPTRTATAAPSPAPTIRSSGPPPTEA
jgi:hypothetical protein